MQLSQNGVSLSKMIAIHYLLQQKLPVKTKLQY